MSKLKPRKIVVGSKNPIKIRAIEGAYRRMLDSNVECIGMQANSDVSDQPTSDLETLTGAKNRSDAVRRVIRDADLWVGVEGGIEIHQDDMSAFAWIYIQDEGRVGKARTATFPLPPRIAELVAKGHELGEADDIVFGRKNSKQNDGAVGLLTDGVIDRLALYQHAALMALIPFKQTDLFGGP